MPDAHDESLTSDSVSRPFLGYSTHDESLTEDRVIGPARLSFTGALDITVVRGADQPIHARAGVGAQFGFVAVCTGEKQRARAGWGS